MSAILMKQTLDKDDNLVGVVVCKLEPHRHPNGPLRGYIAMLVVATPYRNKGIATRLVRTAIDAMIARGAELIALETESDNKASMRLYERMGFLRSKSLHHYYLNGNTAFRLVLYVKEGVAIKSLMLSMSSSSPEVRPVQ
jgi:peptide alpha-N-acetyltransferase